MPDLKIIKLPRPEPLAGPDNGFATGSLRNMAATLDDGPQVLAVAVAVSYEDGSSGTMWIGDDVLDLLKAVTVVRIRLEREVE